MDAFTEYDTGWRKDLSVNLWEKEEGTNDNRNGRGKKDRCKVEIQRGKEAEKCSAVPVDRHALKKITVSSGILKEEEHTAEQVRKDTPGSQRNSASRSILWIPGHCAFLASWFHDFCQTF